MVQINFFYLTSLSICILSIIAFYLTFVHGNARYERIPEEQILVSRQQPQKQESIREVLGSIEVWTLAAFLLFYVGCVQAAYLLFK